MKDLGLDLRLALRSLRGSPAPALFAVGILAVAIAGVTSTFTLFSALVLRSLPLENPERLVQLNERAPAWNLEATGISAYDFSHWESRSETFEAMAVYASQRMSLFAEDSAQSAEAMKVSRRLLDVFGLQPALGRTFSAEEDSPGGPHVALLGHSLWNERFAGSPDVLGTTLRLDGDAYEIIGVLPPAASFFAADLWTPLALDPQRGSGGY